MTEPDAWAVNCFQTMNMQPLRCSTPYSRNAPDYDRPHRPPPSEWSRCSAIACDRDPLTFVGATLVSPAFRKSQRPSHGAGDTSVALGTPHAIAAVLEVQCMTERWCARE